MLEIKQLYFKRENRMILNAVGLEAARGKITAIIGPSGTGKSTLLKLMTGELRPHTGFVLINGVDINRLSLSALYAFRRKTMGMLVQSAGAGLFTHLSVFDNIAFPLRRHTNLSSDMIRTLVLLKLELVGLRGTADLMPNELSGGMARRVGLARAIALDPQLMLYDEPFTGQDPISKAILLSLIKRLNDVLKCTTVIVSHDINEVMQIAHQIVLLVDGTVMEEGSPKRFRESKLPWVKQFMAGELDGPIRFHYPSKPLIEDLFE